jgi:predicted nucleic acid-binding protein
MKRKLNSYNIIHYNEEVSELAVKLVLDYRLWHGLTIPDAIIAAMSVVYDIRLFTYNVKDFKFIPSITLYEPHRG